jgi:hypothetical protein
LQLYGAEAERNIFGPATLAGTHNYWGPPVHGWDLLGGPVHQVMPQSYHGKLKNVYFSNQKRFATGPTCIITAMRVVFLVNLKNPVPEYPKHQFHMSIFRQISTGIYKKNRYRVVKLFNS